MVRYKHFLTAAAVAAATPALTAEGPPFALIENPDGDSIEWDIRKGTLPAFVFTGTDITASGAEFFCSESRGAVWARVSGTLYAVNGPASAPDIKLGEAGKAMHAIAADSRDNLITANEDVTTRVVAQAERLCEPEPVIVKEDRKLKPLDYAYSLCQVVDSSKIASEPCSLSPLSKRIDISVDATPAYARVICKEIAAVLAEKKWILPGWELHISSPFSGEKSTAYCRL